MTKFVGLRAKTYYMTGVKIKKQKAHKKYVMKRKLKVDFIKTV